MKFTIAHIFCGIGGKGMGAAAAVGTFGDVSATFETIGGIDLDPLACRDFEQLVGAPALCADIFDLEPADLIRFFGPVAPDVFMLSPPCKGFSALLSATKAKTAKYQRMNQLMERALFLICATWPTPPKLIFVENVPRIVSRGAETLRRSVAIGEAHDYAIVQGTHDCGELGGLAQHRMRFFMLWRHRPQMPQCVYQPTKHRVRACGEVLGPMPMPGDLELGGPMHALPNLSWRNWLRLAQIPAGGDWRDLPGTLAEGQPRREKFRRDPVTSWADPAETVTGPGGSASTNVADPRFGNVDRVSGWDEPVGTVTSKAPPSSGGPAIADPRIALGCTPRRDAYGVLDFGEPSPAVTGAHGIDNARAAVADPRFTLAPNEGRHWNKYALTSWEGPAPTVIGAVQVGSGAPSVADPRFGHVDRVTAWSDPVGTITSSPAPSSGAAAVADPRWGGGRYGVSAWDQPAATVTGESLPSNGANAVADPRIADALALTGERRNDDLGVLGWVDPAATVTADARPRKGRFAVADPRFDEGRRKNWQHVAGVTAWTEPAPTVTAGAKIHAGAFQVADPRIDASRYRILTLEEALHLELPLDKPPPFIPLIVAEDGTWHRPLTTLELAVLQSFPAVIDGKPLVLAMRPGARSGHTRWREGVGNAVPPLAALGIAKQLLRALVVAALRAFELSSNDIWVAPEQRALVV